MDICKAAFEKWMEDDGRTTAPRPAVDIRLAHKKTKLTRQTPISDKKEIAMFHLVTLQRATKLIGQRVLSLQPAVLREIR